MMGTMAINPAFLQGSLLRQSVMNPLAGGFNTNKVTAENTSAAMKQNLANRETGIRSRMNEAMTVEMANKLALEQGYLGIGQGRLALGQRQLGLDTQRLGLSQQEQGWREKNWRKNYETEKSNLWKTGAMGLGTAAWSAYEGNRRAREQDADRELMRRTNQNMYAMQIASLPPPVAQAGWANYWQH